MNKTTVIRYQTRPEAAEENERLVRAVFEQLAQRAPDGLRYAAFRMDDGVTFVHVVTADDTAALTSLPAFAEFQRGIADRVTAAPEPTGATIVGSYP